MTLGCVATRPTRGGHIGDWMEDTDGTRMTVIAAAARLGISQPALSRVLNGRAGISPSLALKLEAAGWGKADMWNSMQAHYDLAQERNRIGQWPPDPKERMYRRRPNTSPIGPDSWREASAPECPGTSRKRASAAALCES